MSWPPKRSRSGWSTSSASSSPTTCSCRPIFSSASIRASTRDHLQFVEADRLGPDPLRVGEFRERGTAPLAERGVERVERRVRIGFEERVAVGEVLLEAARVDERFRNLEHVAGRPIAERRVFVAELHEASQTARCSSAASRRPASGGSFQSASISRSAETTLLRCASSTASRRRGFSPPTGSI